MRSAAAPERSPVEGALVGWCLERRPTADRLPVAVLTKAEKAAELQRVQARKAMDAAYEAELVLGLADDTPDTLDPPPDHPGARKGSWAPDAELPGVSEFFVPELAVVLNCGRGTAGHLAVRAWTYRENLPATWAAMAEGVLDEPRAKVLADVLAHASPRIARQIEAELLPEAAGLSTGRLRRRALALLLELDADPIDARRADARRQADVRAFPSHLEGMSTLAADLPTPVSAECPDVVDRLAAMLNADGDPRPIGELRAAVLADLIRRPWDTSRPTVTAHLAITAPLPSLAGHSGQPGEVNGQPITAAHVRELLARLGALGLRAPDGGALALAITDADGRLLATTSQEQLEKLARRGCRQHPGDHCGCAVLGPPSATAAYEPTPHDQRSSTCATAPAASPTAGSGWAGPTTTTSSPMPAAGRPSAPTCVASAAATTGSRPWPEAGGSSWTTTAPYVTTPSGITRTTRPPGLRPPVSEPPGPPSETGPSSVEDDPPPF